jgi:hypothetical protein
MKFIKYLKKGDVAGYVDRIEGTVWVNFSHGLSESVPATFHEFYHFMVGYVWYSIPNPYCQERGINRLFDFLNDFIHRIPLIV